MPLRADIEDFLNTAVFGTSTAGSPLTLTATITNVDAVVFQPANVHLHVEGELEDMGDGGQFPGVTAYAEIPADTLTVDDLPRGDDNHGTLLDDRSRLFRINSVDQHGSRIRLYLSSQVL